MPSKNDLSGLKTATQKPDILPAKIIEPVPKREPVTRIVKMVGRPPKPKAEKRSYKVTLSLTEAEGKLLAEKSGLAGDATYLYAQLKKMNAI